MKEVAIGFIAGCLLVLLFSYDVHATKYGSVNATIVSPIESNGGIPVNIQDQTTESIDLYFHVDDSILFAAQPAVTDQDSIIFATGHGYAAGMVMCIISNGRYQQVRVLSVTTTVVRIDMPLSCPLATTDTLHRGRFELNVDGSTSKKVFEIEPPAGVTWDIVGITFHIEDNAAMDDGTFGGMAALTKGVFLRVVDGFCQNLFCIKSNGEFAQRECIVSYAAKPPSGTGYGVTASKDFAGQENNGVAIRLNGSTGDELKLYIQDNLTSLSKFRATVHGHVVQN